MSRLLVALSVAAGLAGLASWAASAAAQGNFEIQVYGSETTAPGTWMVELHSNAAIQGATSRNAGPIRPTQDSVHETLEIRPIIDKQIGPWYFVVNPVLDQSLNGPGTHTGIEFSPQAKLGYDLTTIVSPGIEYYGGLGPIGNFLPPSKQQ